MHAADYPSAAQDAQRPSSRRPVHDAVASTIRTRDRWDRDRPGRSRPTRAGRPRVLLINSNVKGW